MLELLGSMLAGPVAPATRDRSDESPADPIDTPSPNGVLSLSSHVATSQADDSVPLRAPAPEDPDEIIDHEAAS